MYRRLYDSLSSCVVVIVLLRRRPYHSGSRPRDEKILAAINPCKTANVKSIWLVSSIKTMRESRAHRER